MKTLDDVASDYFKSARYRSLRGSTQLMYERTYSLLRVVRVGGRSLGKTKVSDLTSALCQEAYNKWSIKSPQTANTYSRIFSILMTHAMLLDLTGRNPMAVVQKIKREPRSVVWTKDQIKTFLDTAFSEYRWRSIGLIAYMAYEWAQRPVDIRLLKWKDLNLEEGYVRIHQSKRGATVELPIPPDLLAMLEKQKEDFGFQEWVVPVVNSSDKGWKPYKRKMVSNYAKEVIKKAGLPPEIQMGDLRKTAILEMVEAGVDSTQIRSVTGHRNISSLNPYLKNTLTAATAALTRRKTNGH